MSLFRRLFSIGRAEGHAMVDKLEDPSKMIDQGLRELREDLQKAMQALAEVKAAAIRSRREHQTSMERARNYKEKARGILANVKAGKLDEAEGDRLATEALRLAKGEEANAARLAQDSASQGEMATRLQNQVNDLQSKIGRFENEARSLKARQKTAESVQRVNKQLSGVDSSGTIAMLERMRERVDTTEASAQAYAELADGGASLDDAIDRAALEDGEDEVDAELAALKAGL